MITKTILDIFDIFYEHKNVRLGRCYSYIFQEKQQPTQDSVWLSSQARDVVQAKEEELMVKAKSTPLGLL